jgi:hypothetical protein
MLNSFHGSIILEWGKGDRHLGTSPRCGAHRGGSKPPGPPKGNQDALKHGFFVKPAASSGEEEAKASMGAATDQALDELSEELFPQPYVGRVSIPTLHRSEKKGICSRRWIADPSGAA